ncbi:hypothetical protein B0H13DRAFT_2394158 [Mycena leptocephala]|nr:hypothetical protein B0H13DRAFT_2394158 [Mycena leptocephala]
MSLTLSGSWSISIGHTPDPSPPFGLTAISAPPALQYFASQALPTAGSTKDKHEEECIEKAGFNPRPVWHHIAGPYPPDFNPIEEAFSKIKASIRRNDEIFSYGPDDEPHALIYDMLEAMNIITKADAIGYFIHAGYF